MYLVDIEVPNELHEKLSEMSPLFVVDEVPDNMVPQFMKNCKEKTEQETVKGTEKLLSVMKA